ncbi:serine protease [Pediococcus damnosus LMG 28219]|uniref:S1C family serine protease n=1 Tax=Pediococcus damnosus TaxID=51663 RepID=UPI00061F24B4|nr:trypsin-like peptidase domain-containing protein [Pediococcus damnosus]KJU73680.1 serine protease [Pediococcus damnosus LMG 28219]
MKNKNLWTVIVTALIAGLIGGGIAFGVGNYINNRQAESETAVPSGSNSTGTTKTSNVNVNSSQSEKAYSSIKNAVVTVINLKKESSNSNNSLYGSIFGNSSSSSNSSSKSNNLETYAEGSGVIYKKSGNAAYVVTNNHVISGSNAVEIIMSNGKKLSAKVVGKDSVTDLAVLKINSSEVSTVASFGNSNSIKVGETALAIGSPLGSDYATSLTQGIISAKKRTVATTNESGQETGEATVIQTDAAINSGNSGGPLINLAGQVVGINSMKLASSGSSGTSVEGMGFAIPSNEVVTIINQLIEKGKIVRPAIGASLLDLTDITASQQKSILKLPSKVTEGAVIYNTYASSPARNAGLKKYDVVTNLDGTKITSVATLRDKLYKLKVGDSVKISWYRGSTLKTGIIKLTETTSELSSQDK